jgi:hypothetical protein
MIDADWFRSDSGCSRGVGRFAAAHHHHGLKQWSPDCDACGRPLGDCEWAAGTVACRALVVSRVGQAGCPRTSALSGRGVGRTGGVQARIGDCGGSIPEQAACKKPHNHARLAGEPPSVALRCTRAANRAYLTLPQQLSLALTVSGNTNCTAKVHNCPPPAGSPREAGGTAQELGSPCLQGEPKVGGRQLLFFVKFGSAIGKCLCSEI